MQHRLTTYYGLLERHRLLIVATCYKYARGKAELLRELVQEATLNLWKNFDTLNAGASEKEQAEWVRRCTRSAALNYLRRKRPKTVPLEHAGDIAADTADLEAVAGLDELMAHLAPDERQLVERHLYGIKNGELAEQMGVTTNTVAIRLSRIIKKMRKIHEKIERNEKP